MPSSERFATDVTMIVLQTILWLVVHTYHSRFIPKGVAEASQIFLRVAHDLPKPLSYEEICRRDRR
jgi:hypothetical protein